MGRKLDVGRSSRTPVKHYLLNASLGKVCGVLAMGSPKVPCKITNNQPLICVDLCGGDGLKNEDHDASPLIMYHHCEQLGKRGKRATLQVIEKQENTFEQLQANCDWMDDRIVTLSNADAHFYRLPKLTETQAAYVHCDPNHVNDIPLTTEFVSGFNKFTTYLVTLGCNVTGLKRKTIEERSVWYEYVEMLISVLPNHHDATLFWLNRDEAQWAYLLSFPKLWAEGFKEKAIEQTSKQWTKGVSAVSWRDDQRGFMNELHRLFLTKEEHASLRNN